jgi:N-acetylneuraminic acid mutarotase
MRRPDVLEMLLCAGGTTTGSPSNVESAEVFDSRRNEWRVVANMNVKRCAHAAVTLNDHVIVSGGYDGKMVLSFAERYNVTTNSWSPIGDMLNARYHHALANLNGTIYALGGRGKDNKVVRTVERYDAERNSWQLASPLQCARYAHAAASWQVSLSSNCAYIVS